MAPMPVPQTTPVAPPTHGYPAPPAPMPVPHIPVHTTGGTTPFISQRFTLQLGHHPSSPMCLPHLSTLSPGTHHPSGLSIHLITWPHKACVKGFRNTNLRSSRVESHCSYTHSSSAVSWALTATLASSQPNANGHLRGLVPHQHCTCSGGSPT